MAILNKVTLTHRDSGENTVVTPNGYVLVRGGRLMVFDAQGVQLSAHESKDFTVAFNEGTPQKSDQPRKK